MVEGPGEPPSEPFQLDDLVGHVFPEGDLAGQMGYLLEALAALSRPPFLISGKSSFNDVTSNKLSVIMAFNRYWEEEGNATDQAIGLQAAALLKRYLDMLVSRPDILAAEMRETTGAFPALRQQADVERLKNATDSAIDLYIDWLCAECQKTKANK